MAAMNPTVSFADNCSYNTIFRCGGHSEFGCLPYPHSTNKRKMEDNSDISDDHFLSKRYARSSSAHIEMEYKNETIEIEENARNRLASAEAMSRQEKQLRTLDDYFPLASSGKRSGHLHTHDNFSEPDCGNTMDVSHTCVNCLQIYFRGELLNCNFCLKEICNICDSTCRRCGLSFCRNCSTTLYTQFSEDLVCLDCHRAVYCIS